MHNIRPRFLTLAFTASLLFWASITVTPATADLVKFNFTGTVTNVNTGPGIPSSIVVNSTLTGSYLFESSTGGVPNSPFAHTQQYPSPISNLTFHLGDFDFNGSPANLNSIYVGGDLFVGGEEYVVDTGFLGNASNASDPGTLQLALFGGFGDSIDTSLSLPTTPPDLNVFFFKGFRVVFSQNNGYGGDASGTLDTLKLAPVPLPPAVILFGAGLVALIGLGAGHWRQKRPSLT